MKITKNVLVLLIAASACQVAQANFTINDLYLGFNESSAQSDYIIDLGQPSVVGVGGTTVVDLSSHFSQTTFNSVFSGGANGVGVATVAASTAFNAYDVYATQVRTGGAGNPAVPGSSITAGHSSSQINGGASALTGIMSTVGGLPTAGNSALDSSKSYTSVVDTTGSALNFIGKTGVIPFGTFDSSGIVYLDLYKASVSSNYTYLGYFKFDLSTATPHLSFTPSGAPNTGNPPSPTLGIVRAGNVNSISFTSASSATYTLYFTNSAGLTAPVSTWPAAAGTISGDGSIKTFNDTTTDLNRFYRVKAQ